MKQVAPTALLQSLNKLAPYYLLTGNDFLLVDEAKREIISVAKQEQFNEKKEFTINKDDIWNEIFDEVTTLSLFSQRKIIILNFGDKPNASQLKQLTKVCENLHSDVLLILWMPKFNKLSEKENWFSFLQEKLIVVNCYPLEGEKLFSWINWKAKQFSLELETNVVKLLNYNYEGNLMAIKQILEILALNNHKGKISSEVVMQIIHQAYLFTPFQLIDSLLSGNIVRTFRVLNHLEEQGVEAVLLMRLLQKELFILLELTESNFYITEPKQNLQTGDLTKKFNELKIWQTRRLLYQNVLNHFTYNKLYQLIIDLAQIEIKLKQEFANNIWQELQKFCVKFIRKNG